MSQDEDDFAGYVLKYARYDQYGKEAVIRAEYNRCRSQNELAETGVYFGKISTRKKNEEQNIGDDNRLDRLEDETYASVDTENAPVKSENTPVDAPVKLKNVLVNEASEDISIEEKVLQFCSEAKGILEICEYLGYKDKRSVRKIIDPLLELGRLAMTVPDKPNSRNQKYISIKQCDRQEGLLHAW